MAQRRWQRSAGALLTLSLAGGFAVAAHGDEPVSDIPAPADPATVPGYDHDPLSLLGPSRVDAAHLAAFVRSHDPRTTVPIEELAEIFLEEGAALGVRADLAWTQSIIETGFFHFPDRGMVHPEDNNFAGIGACDSCDSGHGYPSARIGVRAQMQLLRGYADPNTLADAMIRPPKSYRGAAPTWWQMGNGHWATAPNYAAAITSMYARLLRSADIDLAYLPPEPLVGASHAAPPTEPTLRVGDGLYVADPSGQVYDLGDARFWGSAYQARHGVAVSAIAMTPGAQGYWLAYRDGVVMEFGDAPSLGRAPRNTVALAAQPRGYGYWTVDSAGRVSAFGDAPDLAPGEGAIAPDARIVDIVATRSGLGYWLIDSVGRVTPVGDAVSFGDAQDIDVADPVVGIAVTPWDDGYWIATAGGAVQAFGAARDHGGLGAEYADDADRSLYRYRSQQEYYGALEAARRLVVAIRPTPTGDGYWIVATDGTVIGRGDAADFEPLVTNGSPLMAATSRLDTAAPLRPAATDD